MDELIFSRAPVNKVSFSVFSFYLKLILFSMKLFIKNIDRYHLSVFFLKVSRIHLTLAPENGSCNYSIEFSFCAKK